MVAGGQRVYKNVHPHTESHVRYNSGQYLFFIPFSTRCTVTKDEQSYGNEQHEVWGAISKIPPKLEA